MVFGLALGRGVEAVGNEVEKHAGDLLREQIDLARGRIEGALQRNVEALLFGACAVIGEIEALFHQGIDIDLLMLARALPRVQQHVLDNRVRALTVLYDLFKVTAQHVR